MKKNAIIFLTLVTLLTASGAELYAGGKECPYGDKKQCDKGQEAQCPLVAKFMKKAEFFLANQQQIGLSAEQVGQIKALKTEEQKAYIRAMADMQVLHIDIDAKMSEPKVDVAAISALIDTGMTGMTAGAKATVNRYAQLKGVLTDEQMAKAKEIWLARA